MKNSKSGFTSSEVLFTIFLLFCGYGWIANMVKVFLTVNDPATGKFILRMIGIFIAPIGIILGYF